MIKLLLLFSFFSITLNALEWKSYEAALKEQKKSKRLIMIDVMRTDCHYCIKMDRKVFDDPEMSEWLSKRFIPVKLNLDTDFLPLDIKVNFTPSFFFVNENQEIVKKIPGSWNIQDFKDLTKGLVK